MLILSCQRKILPMLSIGQTDVSIGHSVKNIMQPMHCLLSGLDVWAGRGDVIQLNKRVVNQSLCLTVC